MSFEQRFPPFAVVNCGHINSFVPVRLFYQKGIYLSIYPPQAQRHARGTLPRRGALASGA